MHGAKVQHILKTAKEKGKNLVESFGIVLTYSYLCSTLSDNKT